MKRRQIDRDAAYPSDVRTLASSGPSWRDRQQ
jgi:hypothetical protein